MSMGNDENTDNIELNKAIADSISSLNYHQNEQEKEDIKSDDNDDIDLENAIGDVFNQFDFGNTDSKPEEEEQKTHEDKEGDDLELNKAIGNVLGSIDVNKQQTSEVSQSATDAGAERNASGSDNKESSSQNEDGLEEAIGDAFSSLKNQPEIHKSINHESEILNDRDRNEDLHQHADELIDSNEGQEDDDLEKAIRDAFESNQQPNDSEKHQHNDSTTATHEPLISTDNNKQDQIESERLDEVIDGAFSTLENSDHQRQTNDEQDNDEDLNRAIANAFSGITENDNNHDISDKNHGDDGDDDLDLNEAIGNAFKNISELGGANDGSKTESRNQTETNENQTDHHEKPINEVRQRESPDDRLSNTINNVLDEYVPNKAENNGSSNKDDDLHDAISASFKQLIGDDNLKKDVNHVSQASDTPQLNKGDKHENIDAFMENVISEAFRNVAEQSKDSQETNASLKRSDNDKQGETGFDLANLVQNMVNQISNTEENTKSNQGTLPISEDILQELALEITNQVQDQLEDESHKKSKTITDMPQIDENVLAHFQNEAYKDDNNDGDKLDSNKAMTDDNTLQAALATAVRNAIENNATTLNDSNRRLSLSQGPKQDNETEDLEQLQMNDILQNAFNMAMENPHDLLSNLEMEDENDEHHNKIDENSNTQSSQVATALAKLPHPLPASTTTFLESLNRSNDIDLSGSSSNRKKKSQNRLNNLSTSSESISSQADRISTVAKNIMSNFANKSLTFNNRDETKKNSLSIAETLALHRSSMNNVPRRDYSSIESLEGALRNEPSSSPSSDAINSQVSSVLSSLSSRINSATSNSSADNNLLQVIRQMTSALTSKPNTASSSYLIPTTTPSVSDIIASYKDKKDENAIISPLVLAKKFLEDKQMAPGYGKAVSLLDNVLELFNSNLSGESQIDPSMKATSFSAPQLNLDIVKPELISSISNSVASAISSFSSRSKKGSIFGERIKTDSPEYKERIRLENRERKKRWREENAERNKDNDLRSRVLKRATLMFGEKDTPEKKSWVDDEFNKRREKRIAKQKKDDYERQNKGYTNEDNLDRKSFRDKEPNALVNDPDLIRPVTDIFNIVSNFNQNEDPDAALAATSAATATAAAIYANTHSTTNFKLVESAVSKILLSLMENSHSDGQDERITSLSKGVTSSFKLETSPTSLSAVTKQTLPSKLPDSELTSLVKTTPTSTSGILNRLSATIRGFSPSSLSALSNSNNVPTSLLQLQNLTLNNQNENLQKRKSNDPLPHDAKRSRPSSPLSEAKSFIENVKAPESASISNIASNLDNIRNAISNSDNSHLLSSSNALKIPHYKKPDVFSAASMNSNADDNIDPAIKKEYPTLSLASTSPFISNKSNYLSGNRSLSSSVVSQASVGLRKPGSFQRPSYSKPDKSRQKVFGYPQLHSTSLKEN